MHRKEQVLAPLLEKELKVKCFVSEDFDTNRFGTFSGEIERKESAHQTVRNKCLAAMDAIGCDLAVASEGSFGSHPISPFLPANEEMVIFIDKKNDLEILGRVVEIETNFAKEEVSNWDELKEFSERVYFPSHALILRYSESSGSEIIKGINDIRVLEESFKKFINKESSILVETDMRALYNPTRMQAIGKAGKNLIENILSCCPKCKTPGFSASSAKPGLPCQLCGTPSRSIFSITYQCKKCQFQIEKEFPHGKQYEDPMYCDRCNP